MQEVSCCKAFLSCSPCFSIACCNNSRRYSSIRRDIITRHPVCCILCLMCIGCSCGGCCNFVSYNRLLVYTTNLASSIFSITDIRVVEEDSLVFNSDFSVKVRLVKEFPIVRVCDVLLVDAVSPVAGTLVCITPCLLVVDSPALKMVKI